MNSLPHWVRCWLERWEWSVPLGAAVVVTAASFVVNPGPWALLFGAVVGSAAGLLLFGVCNAVQRVRGESPRGIPGLTRRVPAHLQWKVALAVGLVFFGLREGALAPDFVLTFNSYELTRETRTNHTASSRGTRMGDARPVVLRGRRLTCMRVQCSGDDVVCSAFDQASPCGRDREGSEEPTANLDLSVNLSSSGACWMPLTKSGEFRANLSGSLQGRREGPGAGDIASKNVTFRGTVNLDQTMTGPASCRVFRRQAGFHLANKIFDVTGRIAGQH